jgi:rhamnosyltransferase
VGVRELPPKQISCALVGTSLTPMISGSAALPEPDGSNIGAVVVTFQPDWGVLGKVLDSVSLQVARGVVIDNGSPNSTRIQSMLPPRFSLLLNPQNRGIGAALNQGVSRLRVEPSIEWVLTLDQDTILDTNYVSVMSQRARFKIPPGHFGILTASPAHTSGRTGRMMRADFVYATGNLVRVSLFGSARYREEFFMDQIDHDFCYQVRKNGYEILLLDQPMFKHNHGNARELMGRSVRYEPASRYGYLVRNSTVLLREGRIPLGLYIRQLLQWGILLAVCESPLQAIRSGHQGLRDAISGRLGPM